MDYLENPSDTLPLSEGGPRGGLGSGQRCRLKIISSPQASSFWFLRSAPVQGSRVTSPWPSPWTRRGAGIEHESAGFRVASVHAPAIYSMGIEQ
jgi:hypothetical protein